MFKGFCTNATFMRSFTHMVDSYVSFHHIFSIEVGITIKNVKKKKNKFEVVLQKLNDREIDITKC